MPFLWEPKEGSDYLYIHARCAMPSISSYSKGVKQKGKGCLQKIPLKQKRSKDASYLQFPNRLIAYGESEERVKKDTSSR